MKLTPADRRRLLAALIGGITQGVVLTLLNKYAERHGSK